MSASARRRRASAWQERQRASGPELSSGRSLTHDVWPLAVTRFAVQPRDAEEVFSIVCKRGKCRWTWPTDGVDVKGAHDLGANSCAVKPVEFDALSTMVQNIGVYRSWMNGLRQQSRRLPPVRPVGPRGESRRKAKRRE